MVDDVQLCRKIFNAQDGLFERGLTIIARALFAMTSFLATATEHGDAIERATIGASEDGMQQSERKNQQAAAASSEGR